MSISFPFSRARSAKGTTSMSSRAQETNGSRCDGSARAGTNGVVVADDDGVVAGVAVSSSPSSSSLAQHRDHDDVIKTLRSHVSRYAKRDNAKGLRLSLATLFYFVLTALAPWLVSTPARSLADALRLSPPARSLAAAALWSTWGVLRAAAYVRSFMLMHDCVHGNLFESRALNKRFGFVFGVSSWLSSAAYQRKHLVHHMRLGIEEEGPWDADRTAFWTVKEWKEWKPSLGKFAARVVRSPCVYFPLCGPIFLLLFGSTAPAVGPNLTPRQKLGKLYEANAARIALIVLGTASIAGVSTWGRVAAEYAAGFLAMAVGVATFSITHTYGEGYIKPRAEHSRDDAALRGSSRVVLPKWLAEHVFMNITEHHIHHFDARVPCFALRECHEEAPDGIWERAGLHSLRSWGDIQSALGLALWDEERERHVPFPPLSLPLPRAVSSLFSTWRLAAKAA